MLALGVGSKKLTGGMFSGVRWNCVALKIYMLTAGHCDDHVQYGLCQYPVGGNV